jgi:hypothetical protein
MLEGRAWGSKVQLFEDSEGAGGAWPRDCCFSETSSLTKTGTGKWARQSWEWSRMMLEGNELSPCCLKGGELLVSFVYIRGALWEWLFLVYFKSVFFCGLDEPVSWPRNSSPGSLSLPEWGCFLRRFCSTCFLWGLGTWKY